MLNRSVHSYLLHIPLPHSTETLHHNVYKSTKTNSSTIDLFYPRDKRKRQSVVKMLASRIKGAYENKELDLIGSVLKFKASNEGSDVYNNVINLTMSTSNNKLVCKNDSLSFIENSQHSPTLIEDISSLQIPKDIRLILNYFKDIYSV